MPKSLLAVLFLLVNLSLSALAQVPEQFDKALQQHRYTLTFDGERFAGAAWQRLLSEGQEADFFLIGEEHGIAENPKLAAQLFAALTESGYQQFVIEVSPQIAELMEQRLDAEGLQGLKALFNQPGGEPAFFGMAPEAQLLAAVVAALPKQHSVLWGVDYEVASDRPLIQWLGQQNLPNSAKEAYQELVEASNEAWRLYREKQSPQYVFSFSGDPVLLANLRDAWPSAPAPVNWLLDELEQTLRINQLWVQGQGWQSNALRAQLLRENFLRHWQALAGDRKPKVMAKLGASHLIRGRNTNQTFDLGTLLPEIAAIDGGKSLGLLVLPGQGSQVAVLNPVAWQYVPAPAKDGYAKGLDPLYAQANESMTLFDMAAIRPLFFGKAARENPELTRIAHGFDYVLIMTGSTPSPELVH